MRKLLNVLYVTTPEAYLSRDGENVVVRVDQEERFRVPIHILESIVCFGYLGASPGLMSLCAEKGVGLSFLTAHGRFQARLVGPVSGNVLLRRQQYRMADDPLISAKVASWFVTGKIANSRAVLRRAIRDHGSCINTANLTEASEVLDRCLHRVRHSEILNVVRGIEGEAAQIYFANFNALVLDQQDDFYIKSRNRRPPRDNLNALLSFLYTLLQHDVRSALETVGLDPYVGFLHRDRPGRPSLALDLMEEFRPYLADRLALSLINRKQITGKGFRQVESGGIFMDEETRKIVLTAWQKRKQEVITHPYLEEKIEIGLLPYAQALLFARYIRGDIDGYPPFFWR